MSDENTILVTTAEDFDLRGRAPQPLNVEVVADNVNQFLVQIENILMKTPEVVSGFSFSEFEVTAEISGEGKLSLLGTGVGVTAKGGLTFRFQRGAQ